MAFNGFDTLARMLAEAVLNGLWQGLAVTALGWTVLRLAPGTSAATRYGIWSATLVVVLALPGARLTMVPPAPVPALLAPHADVNGTSQMVLAEVRMRTANIFMEAAVVRMASAERLMRAAKEQMRLAQIAAGNGRLPISRVSCQQPAPPAAGAQLNKI